MFVALADLATNVHGVMLALPGAIPITSRTSLRLQRIRAETLIIAVSRQVVRTMLDITMQGTSTTCASRLGMIGRKALQLSVCIKAFSTLVLG